MYVMGMMYSDDARKTKKTETARQISNVCVDQASTYPPPKFICVPFGTDRFQLQFIAEPHGERRRVGPTGGPVKDLLTQFRTFLHGNFGVHTPEPIKVLEIDDSPCAAPLIIPHVP